MPTWQPWARGLGQAVCKVCCPFSSGRRKKYYGVSQLHVKCILALPFIPVVFIDMCVCWYFWDFVQVQKWSSYLTKWLHVTPMVLCFELSPLSSGDNEFTNLQTAFHDLIDWCAAFLVCLGVEKIALLHFVTLRTLRDTVCFKTTTNTKYRRWTKSMHCYKKD